MSVICPTVLAGEPHEFREQMERILPFAGRVQIDLMDGKFAPTKSIDLNKIWWPESISADLHLMYQRPNEYIEQIEVLRPNMVIIHAEASVKHMLFAAKLHAFGIKSGLAILKETPVEWVERILPSFDHLLIFSGDLGRFGGEADIGLLSKIAKAKQINPELEIGWDGGVNEKNARKLANGGVDVLNVGGYIQRALSPSEAYAKLKKVIKQI